MWYRRTFTVPASWASQSARRTLLNFGAVDWESEVWVNGVRLGLHRGGCAHALLTAPALLGCRMDAHACHRCTTKQGAVATVLGPYIVAFSGHLGASGIWAGDVLQHVPARAPLL